jgi:hypothetical protein
LSVRDYWPGTRADYEYVYPEFYGPDSDDYGTPPQVSPVLPWTSGHPGRSYRGRTYWGPVRREHADEGFLDVDGRDAPIAYGNAITNHFAGTLPFAAPEFAIVSEYHDGEPTYPPKFVLPAFFGVDAFLRTQRRRQPNTRLVLG